MSVDYVEFPVDPIVEIKWKKKPPDGGGPGGGEPPTYPCGGASYILSGTFPVNANSAWSALQGVAGNSPDIPPGIPVAMTVSIGGGSYDSHVVYPTFGPPFISQRPAYTNHGCGFDIGVATYDPAGGGGGDFAVVASTGAVDVAEGSSGSFDSVTAVISSPPPGLVSVAAVRTHGGDLESNVHFLLLFVGGGFLNVGVTVDVECSGTAPSEAHEHAPFIPDDQLPEGLTRVAQWT